MDRDSIARQSGGTDPGQLFWESSLVHDDDPPATCSPAELDYYQAWFQSSREYSRTPPAYDAAGRARMCSDDARDEAIFYLAVTDGIINRLNFACLTTCGVPAIVAANLLCELISTMRPQLETVGEISAMDFLSRLGGPSSRVLYRTGSVLLALHRGIVRFRIRSVLDRLFGPDADKRSKVDNLPLLSGIREDPNVALREALKTYEAELPAFRLRVWLANSNIEDLTGKLEAAAEPWMRNTIRSHGCRFPSDAMPETKTFDARTT